MSEYHRVETHLEVSGQPTGVGTEAGDRVVSLLVVGDFSGRSGRAEKSANPAHASTRPWRADREDIDVLLERMAPTIDVAIEPSGAPSRIEFRSLDDFHPDSLRERIAFFRGLTAMQGSAESSSARTTPAPSQSRAEPAAEGRSLLEQMLEQGDAAAPTTPVAAGGDLSTFLRRAVSAHTIPVQTDDQRHLREQIADVTTAAMRVLLHAEDFRALEATWRGLDFLLRRVGSEESTRVFLLDLTAAEFATAARSRRLAAALGLETEGGEAPYSAIVATFEFGDDSLETLKAIASAAGNARIPFLAGGTASLAGAPSFDPTVAPDDWALEESGVWNDLRATDGAGYLCVALPRLLLRIPYGASTDACSFPFEEMPSGTPNHESYLWGSGAIACAVVLVRRALAGNEAAADDSIGGLPLHVWKSGDGESVATACAELLLSERWRRHLLDAGFTVLASVRDSDSIRIPRVQSIALPPKPMAIPWNK